MTNTFFSITTRTKRHMIVVIVLCFSPLFLLSQPEIKELSYFRFQGEIELRTEADFNSKYKYKTLNHEGGVKVRVLKIGSTDVYNSQKGKWLYVILTAPLWADNGEWIEKYNKFWIFLPDTMKVFDKTSDDNVSCTDAIFENTNSDKWSEIKYDSALSKKMPKGTSDLTELIRNPLLFVDNTGKRFCNEEKIYDNKIPVTITTGLPYAAMIIIFDTGMTDRIARNGLVKVFDRMDSMMLTKEFTPGQVYIFRTPKDYTSTMKEAIDAGLAIKADSIGELAVRLKMKNLVTEVADYNTFCDSHNDTRFFKNKKYLYPVKEGPFYAVRTRLYCNSVPSR